MGKTETTDTFASAWAADDWTGQHLIRAPKLAQPTAPTKPENPVQMHFTKRRKIVAELHEQGMTVPEMADMIETIYEYGARFNVRWTEPMAQVA